MSGWNSPFSYFPTLITSWIKKMNSDFFRWVWTLELPHVRHSFYVSESHGSRVILELDHVLDLTLQVNLKLTANSSMTVTLRNRDAEEWFFLHYTASDIHISAQKEHTYHGIGRNAGWVRITRDLVIDVMKGSLFQNKQKKKISRSKIKVSTFSKIWNR